MGSEIRLEPQKARAIRRGLLRWYRSHGRDLPWRRTSDPYCILVSEFMLQQTQVETVVPYYQRFLSRFPDVKSLAAASQSDILKLWEGLGYYARARNLHRSARRIVEQHNGRVPNDYDGLAALPGFGPYTTAAVLSIAFNADHAVLDGNVKRVLCRIFEISELVEKQLWGLAEQLLPSANAGAFNQALMELGAIVCRPKSPDCGRCPLNAHCAAFQSGHPESFPRKQSRKPRPHHISGVGIVWRRGAVLIARRPERGLLGGLWAFPSARQKAGERLTSCCLRAIREETGVEAEIESRFRTVRHTFTHFSVTKHAFQCIHRRGRARPLGCEEVAWAPPGALSDFAFSRADRKLADFLLEPDLLSA